MKAKRELGATVYIYKLGSAAQNSPPVQITGQTFFSKYLMHMCKQMQASDPTPQFSQGNVTLSVALTLYGK